MVRGLAAAGLSRQVSSSPHPAAGIAAGLPLLEELLVAHDRLARMAGLAVGDVGVVVRDADHQAGGLAQEAAELEQAAEPHGAGPQEAAAAATSTSRAVTQRLASARPQIVPILRKVERWSRGASSSQTGRTEATKP